MAQQLPLQPIPVVPASGTLTQAWRDVALHPTRHTFATWAQAAQRQWVILSLVVGAGLATITTTFDQIRTHITPVSSPSDLGRFLPPYTATATSVVAVITSPVGFVLGVLGVAASLAFFMPATYGTWTARFTRALRPWALAQVGLGVVGVLLSGLSLLLSLAIRAYSGPIPNLAALPAVIALGVLTFACGIGLVIYFFVMLLQAGTVGSDLGHWTVLGAALLGYIVAGLVTALLSATIAAPIFITPLYVH
jgi:hypothetical protein